MTSGHMGPRSKAINPMRADYVPEVGRRPCPRSKEASVMILENLPDMVALVREAVSQVPRGSVSTYGDIAAAFGDRAAARAVGEMLPGILGAPVHRIVYSDGSVGGHAGHGGDGNARAGLLRSEGLEVRGGRVVSFADARFRDFRVPPVLEGMRREQELIRAEVTESDSFGALQRVVGLDVSYEGDRAFAAAAVHEWDSGEPISERTAETRIGFPYIPGYLAYREVPALAPLISKEAGTLYLVDGHGTLHPRGAGAASHIGVLFGVPAAGAAKSLLAGKVLDPEAERSQVVLEGRGSGIMLRQGRNRTFVSVGSGISLDTAAEVCSGLLDRGIPSPLRRAHELANRVRREAVAEGKA